MSLMIEYKYKAILWSMLKELWLNHLIEIKMEIYINFRGHYSKQVINALLYQPHIQIHKTQESTNMTESKI